MIRRSVVFGLAAAWAFPAAAQDVRPAAGDREWGHFVSQLTACAEAEHVVGFGAALVRRGRVVARHHHGLADRDLGRPATDSTIYHYGSITKTLTAVAIMQLRDRGLLTLDDPVTRWVPELRRVHNPFGSMDAITIRMLLSHSAGFQDPTWPYRGGEPWEPFEPTEWSQLVAMMPYQRIWFEPGSRFGYSNPAFIYLARVIEALSGDPWEAYVQKNLFAPLGVTRSYFGVTPGWLAAHRSNGYSVRFDEQGSPRMVANGRDFHPGITIPNGGWNAPLDDLATWLAFLSGGIPHAVILARSSLEEMWRPAVARTADTAEGLSFVIHAGTPLLVSHTGDQGGYHAEIALNPSAGVAVAFVFNTSYADDNHPRAPACRDLSTRVRAVLGATP